MIVVAFNVAKAFIEGESIMAVTFGAVEVFIAVWTSMACGFRVQGLRFDLMSQSRRRPRANPLPLTCIDRYSRRMQFCASLAAN